MSGGAVELDVCMVAQGIGPGTIGGVTRWATALVHELPSLRIEMHRAGDPLPPARCYHALMPAAVPSATEAARRGNRPVVLTLHAMGDPWEPAHWRGPAAPEDWSHGGGGFDHKYEPPTHIVAVGATVAQSHISAGASREIEVIPNGSAFGAPLAARNEPIIGYVGRLAPIKGLERLLDAIALVREVNREAHLILVGPDEGPADYGAHLRELAQRPGLRGAVRFTGPTRPELWYPQFAVMAMASDSEGMPLAILEAMAHGVPCVGPDVGGMREAIGEGGLVVAPGDPEALALGILALLGDERRATRLARAARLQTNRWTSADTAAAYAELYSRLQLR